MTFGEIPLADAEGALLAHGLPGENLLVSASFTGRANLYATTAGIATYDPLRLDAINLVDESMTVALLPPNTPVVPRQMVATVKIIPFAAPRPALEKVLALPAAHAPLVRVAGFARLRAALVQTRLPGIKPSVLARTVEATRARLASVGGELISETVVDHDAACVGAALTEGLARGADLMLVLGASAVVDRRDVIPSAIGAAGGVVEHFGMPVDPGNLLLLGELGGKPVIGLPGCARSPRLNGFDWVLQRVAAGLPLGRAARAASGPDRAADPLRRPRKAPGVSERSEKRGRRRGDRLSSSLRIGAWDGGAARPIVPETYCPVRSRCRASARR